MSREEIDKWNARYRSGESHPRFDGAPSPVLGWLPSPWPGARALDLGCGLLRNARALVDAGWEVVAVDGATEGFARAGTPPQGLHAIVADLDEWRPPANSFDLVLAVHYLNRALVPSVLESLRPGGLVALETRVDEEARPGQPPRRFRLAPGEALRLYRGLSCLKAEERDGVARYLFRAAETSSVADV